MRDLRSEISAMQSGVESISDDLVRLRVIKKPKVWLKTYEISERLTDFDELWLSRAGSAASTSKSGCKARIRSSVK